jgi:hypothetical protein
MQEDIVQYHVKAMRFYGDNCSLAPNIAVKFCFHYSLMPGFLVVPVNPKRLNVLSTDSLIC